MRTATAVIFGVVVSSAGAQTRMTLPTPSSFREPSIREMQMRQGASPPAPAPVVVASPVVCHDHVFGTGSGLFVDGRFRDDRLSLRFHLGADPLLVRRTVCHPAVPVYPIYGGIHDPFVRYPYYGYRPYTVVDGAYMTVQAGGAPSGGVATVAEPAPAPDAEASDAQRADAAMAAGDAGEAVRYLVAHLAEHAGDVEGMRRLAVALVLDGRVAEGVAMMALAYEREPSLADRPMAWGGLASADLRRAVKRVSLFANRVESGSAWVALAVLMQAEGREGAALRVCGLARRAGAEEALVARLERALGG